MSDTTTATPDPDLPHSPATYRSKLSYEQLDMLLRPVDGNRVGRANNQSNMEAYDIRAHLNRIFGFANWDGETTHMELVGERWGTNRQNNPAVTVVYRACYTLRVRATDGEHLATYTEWATGDAINFPEFKWGDAHDFAAKTAESQALKRCAMNLGDQFGLSLYRGGSLAPVVGWTMNQVPPPRTSTPVADVDRGVPDVTPETDPDGSPAAHEGAWTEEGNAREQAHREDPETARARQDHAAEASQTRPHPNSQPEPQPEPGTATRLNGTEQQTAQEHPPWRKITRANLPKTDQQWQAAWEHYYAFGVAGFTYFKNIAMNPQARCPDFIVNALGGALEELEAAEAAARRADETES